MSSNSLDEKVDSVKEEIYISDGILKTNGSGKGEVGNAKVKDARNAAFAAAVETGGTDPWSKSAFVLYACKYQSHSAGDVSASYDPHSSGAGAAFLCSCGNGYDGSLMTAINGMGPYQDRFNQGSDRFSWSVFV